MSNASSADTLHMVGGHIYALPQVPLAPECLRLLAQGREFKTMSRKVQPWKHMAVQDAELFAAFVMSPAWDDYDAYQFDFHCGSGRDPGAVFSPWARTVVLWNAKKRIDVVAWSANHPTVIETKPDARLSAFGQIEAYQELFKECTGLLAGKAFVTDSLDPDMVRLCSKRDIYIYLVKPVAPWELEAAIAKSLTKIKGGGWETGLSLPTLLEHPAFTQQISEEDVLAIVRDLTGDTYSDLTQFLARYCPSCPVAA
jgi:hypothetical protein